MTALGFILIGLDPEPPGNGVLGLTVGPIITLAGFIFQFYAILAKTEKNSWIYIQYNLCKKYPTAKFS